MTMVSPWDDWDLFLGQLVETIVAGDDETSHLTLFPDGHDRLGEVQHLAHPGVAPIIVSPWDA